MSDILQRLQGKTELCEALGVEFSPVSGRLAVIVGHAMFSAPLDNDDCPGSALLTTRIMKRFAEMGVEPMLAHVYDESSQAWCMHFRGNTSDGIAGYTMVLAALTACLEVEEGK